MSKTMTITLHDDDQAEIDFGTLSVIEAAGCIQMAELHLRLQTIAHWDKRRNVKGAAKPRPRQKKK
jgi:hypothetical protein